jgi:pyruvate/2-oxoglutarate dehydrogenase complex dihydrolipoamide dehydrogenase (E3) component
MAEYQAGLVVFNALPPLPLRRADYRVVPWCTFTDPELAHVGMTEAQAAEELGAEEVRAFRYETAANDRHIIDGEAPGLVKIVTDPDGTVLGASVLSAHAGELIHEYALAVRQGCRIHDLSGLIHAYPTLAQANKRVADRAMAERYLTGWIPRAVSAWARLTRPR